MTARQKLQHIHRIACSPEFTPDKALILILYQFDPEAVQAALQDVLSRRARVAAGGASCSGEITISDAITRLTSIKQLHGEMILNEVREITPVVWTPEEQAREGGTLRNCVMLAG